MAIVTKKAALTRKTLLPESTLIVLREVAGAIVALFGSGCEVVIHDLGDLDHSVVHVSGTLTGRKIGSCMTDLGLQKVRQGDFRSMHGYFNRTDDGRLLRSSSIFIRNIRGRPIGSFCVNFDVGPLLASQRALRFALPDPTSEVSESFPSDSAEMLQRMMNEISLNYPSPLPDLARKDRVALVAALDDKGAFNLKRAAAIVGTKMGVSRFTVYNYLKEARGNERRLPR